MELISASLLTLFRGTENHGPWLTACLEGAWRGLVGDKLAEVCRPASVRAHELTVEVLDPDWLPALRGMRKEVLKRIRTFAGDEIRSLTLVAKGFR